MALKKPTRKLLEIGKIRRRAAQKLSRIVNIPVKERRKETATFLKSRRKKVGRKAAREAIKQFGALQSVKRA